MTEALPASRIIHIAIDPQSLVTRTPALEVERHKSISDLLHENSFQLKSPEMAQGPYRLDLLLDEDRLHIGVTSSATEQLENLSLTLPPLKKLIHDYTIICENFYKTAKSGDYQRLEAIDMGRRGIHNEGADMLIEMLENKVILDKLTARRLFSLLYVLHMRNAPTL